MMTLYNDFTIGQIVFLRTDTLQLPRVVVAIQIIGDGRNLVYRLCQGTEEDSWHHEAEIAAEKDIMMVTSN